MKHSIKFSFACAGVSLFALSSGHAAITSISESGGDAGKFSIIEPNGSSNGSLFGEDAWLFTDRTHEYNGAAFDASGVLATGSTIASIIGVPSYLVGNQYIANANTHRDNASYLLTLNVDRRSSIYLLLDNRLGDNASTTPPTLGSAGTGLMAWVADMGFVRVNTGISPNGQPDFVGVDEGSSLSTSDPAGRQHAGAGQSNLGVGPGVALNNFFSVYRMDVDAGSITLKEQNGGSLNMYGVVVAPIPEATTLQLGAFLGLGALALRRQLRK